MRKQILLLMILLVTVGTVLAQDIYSVGNFTNASGFQCAAVYLNNQKIYERVPPLGDYNYDASSVVVVDGNVYWAMNSVYANNGQYNYGDIYQNGTVYMNSPSGQSIHINDLTYGGGHLYAGGSKVIGNGTRAVIWRDNDADPYYVLTDNSHLSGVTALTFYNGNVYSVGWQSNGNGSDDGIVWKNGEYLYNYGSFVTPRDVAFYDHSVYVVAHCYVNNAWKTRVYKNSEVLYTLTPDASEGYSISIDAGDVYVTGNIGGVVKIWKNGSVLYSINGSGDANSLTAVANHKGVYHAGYDNGTAKIWLNNTMLSCTPSNCHQINGIYMDELPCENADIRTLPYTESFESGNTTDWACWTKVDTDHNNGNMLSYWHREAQPNTNNYFVTHSSNQNASQQGWLVSPRLFLQPGRDYTTLTFKTREGSPSSYTYEAVLVSTNSDPNNADAYTQVWTQNSPSSSWTTVSVNLAAYQGQAIYIAFKYTGVSGHVWSIDDISVTESWSPCNTPASVPYIESFDDGMNPCWYIIDNDHSGGNKCWQYDSQTHSMMHPYGPSGIFQKGYLFSRPVSLPYGHSYVLKFFSKNQSSGSNMCNKVRIAYNEDGVPDPSHYSTVLWTDQQFPSNWEEVEIPIPINSEGTVTICFDYEGTYAHKWYIDDVRIEQVVDQYTITANANNNAWGTVSGGGTYDAGETCTLTATPASGYQFLSWKKNGNVVSTNPTYSFMVAGNATYTAYFGETPVNYYTVNTDVNPEGAGSVSGGGTYQEGSSVTLTAICNAGYSFSHWNDGNTSNPRTVTVTQNITYTAYYDLDEYTISVYASPNEGGTVTGGGNYHYGETAILTAIPAEGYEFAGWSDGVNDNPRMVTVVSAAFYVAVFNEVGTTYYTVGGYAVPEEAGSVTGTGTYEAGTNVVIAAEANPGYVFSHWDDGTSINPRIVTVNGDMTFVAYFEQEEYTLNVYASPVNGGTVSGGGNYYYGDRVGLYATANTGYDFVGWSDGSSENPHYVTVTGDADYTATFSHGGTTYYTVSTFVSPAGAGSVSGAGTYPSGSSLRLKATANEGYYFTHWNDGVTENPRTITVNNNKSFTAYFEVNTYTVTVNANPANGGTVSGGGTYGFGESAVLTATPNANYTFKQWSDGNVNNPRTVTVTDDATYTALFITQGGQLYTLTLVSADPSLGSVFGGGTYPPGSTVDIFAYPAPESYFVKWSDNNTDNPRKVVLDSDLVLTAYFAANGVVEAKPSTLVVYPNPAKESIRIEGLEKASEVRIYNCFGELVKVVTASADQEIGIGGLSKGLYLVRCGNISLRFIKK